MAKFGSDAPMGRAGEPEELTPCYIFLASDDSSYMTGQILHPNGGRDRERLIVSFIVVRVWVYVKVFCLFQVVQDQWEDYL